MIMKNIKILLLIVIVSLLLLSLEGCKRPVQQEQNNTPSIQRQPPNKFQPIILKTTKNLAAQKDKYTKVISLKEKYGYGMLNYLSGYENIITVIAYPYENTLPGKIHGGDIIPGGCLVVYDIGKDELLRVIKPEEGFFDIYPSLIDKDWIVWGEIDKNESDTNFRIHAINRNTQEEKVVLERKRGYDEKFIEGESISAETKWAIPLRYFDIKGDNLYYEITIYEDKGVFSKENMQSVYRTISSSIYELNLKTLGEKRLIHWKNPYEGISDFDINNDYLAFSITGRDYEKGTSYSNVFIYSFKNGKITQFTDDLISKSPKLTPDNWIIYQRWNPNELLLTQHEISQGYMFHIIMEPIDRNKPPLYIAWDDWSPTCRGVSPSGRFITFEGPPKLFDRNTNMLIEYRGAWDTFTSENIIVSENSIGVPKDIYLGPVQWINVTYIDKLLEVLHGEENKP